MGYYQSFEERTDYDLSIQKETTEFLEKEVERLETSINLTDTAQEELLNDFCDLISILIDCGDLSDTSKKLIEERYIKKQS